VPTAVAVFPHMFVSEMNRPVEWAERLNDVRHWTPIAKRATPRPAEEAELAGSTHPYLLTDGLPFAQSLRPTMIEITPSLTSQSPA
jgi:hypothetical protein